MILAAVFKTSYGKTGPLNVRRTAEKGKEVLPRPVILSTPGKAKVGKGVGKSRYQAVKRSSRDL